MTVSPETILQNDRNVQVGNICVQWAHLEYLLMLAIGALMRVDEHTAKLLAGGLPIRARAKMAWELAVHLEAPAEAATALKAAYDRVANKLDDRRNRAVHGHRLAIPGRSDAETFELYRGKGIGKRVIQTDADLAKLGADIGATASELHSAMLSSGVFHAAGGKPARIAATETF